jgi:predicted component of type VI protein secretion system
VSGAAPRLNQAMKISIEVVQGHHAGFRQSFEKGRWTVGRGPENDLILGQDIKVSRSHLEIQAFAAQVIVKNLNDKNVMLVDGRVMTEAILRPNSHVQVGDSVIKFSFQAGEQKRPQMKVVPKDGAFNPATPRMNQNTTLGANGYNMPGPRTVDTPLLDNPRVRFYGVVLVVGIFGLWLFNSSNKVKKDPGLRDSVAVSADVGNSEAETKKALEERKDFDTPQYRAAQAQFVKGFRDYRQGQYARAMESFQSARAYYPQHALAAKYWTLAKRKFDQQVQAYMLTGRRYLGTQNYRLCQSSMAAVLMQIKDDRNAIYKEAKQYFDECSVKGLGR